MKYSQQEIIQYVQEEDVKFIRLAFCDVFGKQKNISIMPDELQRAFSYGIAIDASAIDGFGDETHSDLFLHPEPDTLMPLPWRPEEGSKAASEEGLQFSFGTEQEFYLFRSDDFGEPTMIPYDHAGYMDIAPEDKGENIRREICLTLEQMGIHPESSHHEQGPGQNEIDFRYSDPMTAADNALTFQTVVKAVALRNGLCADFSPKPLRDQPGNGFHINISVKSDREFNYMDAVIAGILDKISEMTLFLNPLENSYERFGQNKAPLYISWSKENRSQLVRVPAALGEYQRVELRSPDPSTNTYLAFALIIYAVLDGIRNKTELPAPADINLYRADKDTLARFGQLPKDFKTACFLAANSSFIKKYIPDAILNIYCKQ